LDALTLLAVCQLALGTPDRGVSRADARQKIVLVAADAVDRWQPLIAEAARRFGLPQSWIRAVMKAESGGRMTLDGTPITSPAGAMGLMQVMPQTYAAMRAWLGLGTDPYDPRDNILAGTAYLADMDQRYGYPGLFAAYNAGPERFERYLQDGAPLPGETVRYLAQIGPHALATVLAMQAPSASGAVQVADSDTPMDGDFSSGRTLFFAVGQGPSSASSPQKNARGPGQIPGPGGAIFVVHTGEMARSATESAGHLFVPLSHDHL